MKHYKLLLSPDAAVEGDADLSGIDTSFPRALAGKYDFILDKVLKRTTEDSGKSYLEVHLKTTGNWTTTSGESKQAGEILVDRISLTPTEKNTADKIQKRVAALVQCVGARTLNDLTSGAFNGKTVPTKVKVNSESAEYDESNSFNYIVKR